jgi:hypothetical protein
MAMCVAEFLTEGILSIAEPTVNELNFWEELDVRELYTPKVHGREIKLAQF